MRKKVFRKRDQKRASNIPFRSQASMNGVVLNDIATALRGGRQVDTVPTSYGDGDPLNVPCIELEELDGVGKQADSDLSDTLEHLRTSFNNSTKTTTKEEIIN